MVMAMCVCVWIIAFSHDDCCLSGDCGYTLYNVHSHILYCALVGLATHVHLRSRVMAPMTVSHRVKLQLERDEPVALAPVLRLILFRFVCNNQTHQEPFVMDAGCS